MPDLSFGEKDYKIPQNFATPSPELTRQTSAQILEIAGFDMTLVAQVLPGINQIDPAVIQALADGNVTKDTVKNSSIVPAVFGTASVAVISVLTIFSVGEISVLE